MEKYEHDQRLANHQKTKDRRKKIIVIYENGKYDPSATSSVNKRRKKKKPKMQNIKLKKRKENIEMMKKQIHRSRKCGTNFQSKEQTSC